MWGSARDVVGVLVLGCVACATSSDSPPGLPDGVAASSVVTLSGVIVGTQREWRVEEERGARIVQVRQWSVRHGDQPVAWTTVVDGRVDGDGRLLDLVVTRDGTASRWTPPDHPVHWLEASPTTLLRAAAGEAVTLEAWLPSSEQAVTATVLPDPEGVRVETALGDAVWTLDDRGAVTAVRAGAVEVTRVGTLPAIEPADLVALLRLPTEPWPEARDSRYLAVRLDGVDPADLHFPPGQVASDDGVRVERPLWNEIPKALRERVGRRVEQVRAHVRVEPRMGPPDAARTLVEGAGDCNEHAAALVALLAGDGFAARAVTGWVYADVGVEPGLYPHAWVEVWMEEPLGWVPVDPVLGQTIADATHVRARDGVTVLRRPVVHPMEMR